ncbi:glycoside hydrolase family 55 protein [Paenibacillus sp. CC-CFT747]|nr:glycoside hydrolase family 55 protein [Paenibacillus sp. CC-CFT747]
MDKSTDRNPNGQKRQAEVRMNRRSLLKTVGLAGVAMAAGGWLPEPQKACIVSAYIDGKDYGAMGNGVTDDYAAIQAAFDVAKDPASPANSSKSVIVFVPEGTYVVMQGSLVRNYSTTHVASVGLSVSPSSDIFVSVGNNFKGFTVTNAATNQKVYDLV